jgi:hypothetical protein
LSDERIIDALHGRLALGILIVQDLLVILAIVLLSAFGEGRGAPSWSQVLLMPVKLAALLAGVTLIARFVIPGLFHRLARSRELLMLAAIAWAVGLAVATDVIGFSREVGAFVAGVAVAYTEYRDAISTRLTALRDFLLLFFFINLGAHLDLRLMGDQLWLALALAAFVLLIKPAIIMALLGLAGYRKRTVALTGLSMGQISEFSLILAAMGFAAGHLDRTTVSLMTLVALLTITISSYVIANLEPVYERLAGGLGVFERRARRQETDAMINGNAHPEILILGLGRYGARIAAELRRHGLEVLGVDFDPERVRAERTRGLAARYGDAEDPELFASLPLSRARWLVSTIRERDTNLALLQAVRHDGLRTRVAVAADSDQDAGTLQAAGADMVLHPYLHAADRAVDLLVQADGTPYATR